MSKCSQQAGLSEEENIPGLFWKQQGQNPANLWNVREIPSPPHLSLFIFYIFFRNIFLFLIPSLVRVHV